MAIRLLRPLAPEIRLIWFLLTEIRQVFQQVLVGLAIDRRVGQAYFQPVAARTGYFITAGARLDTDIEDQYRLVPAIPGLGHGQSRPFTVPVVEWGVTAAF